MPVLGYVAHVAALKLDSHGSSSPQHPKSRADYQARARSQGHNLVAAPGSLPNTQHAQRTLWNALMFCAMIRI